MFALVKSAKLKDKEYTLSYRVNTILNTIMGYHYWALTRLIYQSFDNRLEGEPWVGTPTRQILAQSCDKIGLSLHLSY